MFSISCFYFVIEIRSRTKTSKIERRVKGTESLIIEYKRKDIGILKMTSVWKNI